MKADTLERILRANLGAVAAALAHFDTQTVGGEGHVVRWELEAPKLHQLVEQAQAADGRLEPRAWDLNVRVCRRLSSGELHRIDMATAPAWALQVVAVVAARVEGWRCGGSWPTSDELAPAAPGASS